MTPREETEDLADLLYRIIGDHVAERRQGEFTQEELAQRLGLARTSIANLERGQQRVPLHHLLHLADVLGADLADLVPSWSALQERRAGERLEELPATGDFVDEILGSKG